jgi:ryanodine receptor 2
VRTKQKGIKMKKSILYSKDYVTTTKNTKLDYYIEAIKTHIKNNNFLYSSQCPETAREIKRECVPTFKYLGINTWIIKENNSYCIIWEDNDNWDIGNVDTSLREFDFRLCPISKEECIIIYKPNPINTNFVNLPEELVKLTEKIAENVHDTWAQERINDGWTYGEKRDDEKKYHPCLIPYDELSEEEKKYDRNTAMKTLKLIVALGYKIKK